MSQDSATAEARKLQAIMQKHGVVCTVELKAGRTWSGDPWYSHKYVVMNHHTAGASTGLTPSYALCRNGRTDLPGPLCNGYGGRDFVYRIVTMGLANHPGTGGPLTLDSFTIPADSARITAWGTEWEHNGTSPWPADMAAFMARANAALDEYHGVGVGRQCEHSTWTIRKIDRNGYTAHRGRDEIQSYLGRLAPTPEDDMPLTDDDIQRVARAVWGQTLEHKTIKAPAVIIAVDTLLSTLGTAASSDQMRAAIAAGLAEQQNAEVDVDRLAASIVIHLSEKAGPTEVATP